MRNLRLGLSILFILASAAATRAADSQTRCSIPLKLRNGIPFVKVMLNGRGPFLFAVDTGTSREAIVSPALVKQLGLPLTGRTWLFDLPGKDRQPVDEVSIDNIALNGRIFSSVRAIVHEPLATLAPYDGVLGFALFLDTVVTIDFPQRCLRLDESALNDRTDPNVLPFSLARNVPVVPVTIDRHTILVQIDSAGAGIDLPESVGLDIEFVRNTQTEIRAQSQLSTFILRGGVMKGELLLGAQRFKQPFVEIGSSLPIGNLGAASLKDFAITFDRKQSLVRFQARNNTHRLSRSQLIGSSRSQRNELSPTRGD